MIADKWSKDQVIIIGIDGKGNYQLATYGKTLPLCKCAKVFGDAAMKAIENVVSEAERRMKPSVSTCKNCNEPDNGNCACMRNKCKMCGAPVGNVTFTYCDKCWNVR